MALGVSAAVGAVDDRGTGGGSRRTVPEFERRLDKRLVISIVAVGVMSFAGVVVETAMNIAFPALMREFGVTTAAVQWVTTGYLLVLSAIMPISSFLIRRFRIRTLFVVAMVAFLVGTLVCAAAPQFVLLIVGRVLQGLGTGIALPLMFTIVLQQVPLAFSDDDAIRNVIERIVAPLGRRIDESSPLVDARLPDGSRVNAIIPPVALKGPSITIRRFNRTVMTPATLVQNAIRWWPTRAPRRR